MDRFERERGSYRDDFDRGGYGGYAATNTVSEDRRRTTAEPRSGFPSQQQQQQQQQYQQNFDYNHHAVPARFQVAQQPRFTVPTADLPLAPPPPGVDPAQDQAEQRKLAELFRRQQALSNLPPAERANALRNVARELGIKPAQPRQAEFYDQYTDPRDSRPQQFQGPPRDFAPPRDAPSQRDFGGPSRDFGPQRDFSPKDFASQREFVSGPKDFASQRDFAPAPRDFGSAPPRDYSPRDLDRERAPPARDIHRDQREYNRAVADFARAGAGDRSDFYSREFDAPPPRERQNERQQQQRGHPQDETARAWA